MAEIKAIETRYAGCRFRSRLEARWAVFFDALGVHWEYEPEGFELPSGRYLPDFRLRGLGGDGRGYDAIWFEVKPNDVGYEDRWSELIEGTQTPLLAAYGMPRLKRCDCEWTRERHGTHLTSPRSDQGSLVCGWPEDPDLIGTHVYEGWDPFTESPDAVEITYGPVAWDGWRSFCVCKQCGAVGTAFEGRWVRVCRHEGLPDWKSSTSEDPRILDAYEAANSARFEFDAG